VGRPWQHAFFAWVIRFLGRTPAYICMYGVVAWYVLFCPFIRRRARYYLNRRFGRARHAATRWWQDYRRIAAFGGAMIDRAVYGIHGPRSLKPAFPEGERLKALVRESKGLIVMNSHVGSWQVALSAFGYLEAPVSIVMHTHTGDIDPRWFQYTGHTVPFSIIDPAQTMGGVMDMIAVLNRREVLAVMGDRIFGHDPNYLAVDFLGAPVAFPVSAYRLASMNGTPIAVLYACKTSYSEYLIKLGRVIRVPAGLGRSNQAYLPYVRQFVESLEEIAAEYPWQFFNFHNMWESTP